MSHSSNTITNLSHNSHSSNNTNLSHTSNNNNNNNTSVTENEAPNHSVTENEAPNHSPEEPINDPRATLVRAIMAHLEVDDLRKLLVDLDDELDFVDNKLICLLQKMKGKRESKLLELEGNCADLKKELELELEGELSPTAEKLRGEINELEGKVGDLELDRAEVEGELADAYQHMQKVLMRKDELAMCLFDAEEIFKKSLHCLDVDCSVIVRDEHELWFLLSHTTLPTVMIPSLASPEFRAQVEAACELNDRFYINDE